MFPCERRILGFDVVVLEEREVHPFQPVSQVSDSVRIISSDGLDFFVCPSLLVELGFNGFHEGRPTSRNSIFLRRQDFCKPAYRFSEDAVGIMLENPHVVNSRFIEFAQDEKGLGPVRQGIQIVAIE